MPLEESCSSICGNTIADSREWGKALAKDIIRICGVSDLPPEGEVRDVSVGNQAFCVARLNGKISAIDNECPHHGGPLGQGTLEDGKVICPWHAYAFDVHTGSCDGAPELNVRAYEVTIQGEDVLLKL